MPNHAAGPCPRNYAWDFWHTTLVLSDPHPEVRVRAAYALACVRPDALGRLLDDADPGVRSQAVAGLWFHRTDAADLHRRLDRFRSREPDPAVRAVIDEALDGSLNTLGTSTPDWFDGAPGGLRVRTPDDLLNSRG
jgi:hypothetical protein